MKHPTYATEEQIQAKIAAQRANGETLRALQQQYFRERNYSNLMKAKNAEAEVDQALAEGIQKDKKTPYLDPFSAHVQEKML